MLLISMPGGADWIWFIIGFCFFFIPAFFYIKTLHSTLKVISIQNRSIAPYSVWLLFIPYFNLIWHFIVVIKMSESIKAEADSRNLLIYKGHPGKSIGITMCVLCCLSLITSFIHLSHFIDLFFNLIKVSCFICWIIYWIKINDYKKLITIHNHQKM